MHIVPLIPSRIHAQLEGGGEQSTGQCSADVPCDSIDPPLQLKELDGAVSRAVEHRVLFAHLGSGVRDRA